MSDGCGPTCFGSCSSCDPVGFCLRMLVASKIAALTGYYSTLIPSTTTQQQLLWELKTWGPLKSDDESSFWPTPTARDCRDTPGEWILLLRSDGRKRIDQLHRVLYVDGLLDDSMRKNLGNLPILSFRVNPNWIEELMGFPTGWTELESSEIPSYRNASKLLDDLL